MRRREWFDPDRFGPETRALLEALYTTVEHVSALTDALYDIAMVNNGEAFATTRTRAKFSLTTGTGAKLYTNTLQVPVVIQVQAQPGDTPGLTGYLYLSRDINRLAVGSAEITAFGEVPSATIILGPAESLFVDATNPNGAGSATITLQYSILPLQGRLNMPRT